MAVLILPSPGGPDVEYSMELEGSTYRLRFRWHERTKAWHLDLADVDGGPIAEGLRLVLLQPLLGGLHHDARPPGDFLCDDATGLDKDPGYEDLGTRVQLLYVEAGTTLETAFE